MSGGTNNMDATERPIIAATTRTAKRRGPRLSRADRTPLGLWFWEIDRVLLLRDGAIHADGDRAATLTDARLSHTFGGPVRVRHEGGFYRAEPDHA